MAKIQETLVLQDRFSSTFSSYLKYAQKAAVATGVLRTSANGDFSKVVDAIVNVNSSLADMARAQTDVSKSLQEQKDTLGELASAATKAAEAAQKATTANRDHKKSTDEAKKSADQLTQSLKSLAASYVSIQGLKKAVDLSDSLVSMRARLDRMNDGLQTTQELETMIYQSAQRSRGSFTDTMGLVSQLGTMAGDAFGSSKEIVQFAEQLNKQLALSGASGSSAQAAILQLEQGLASGVLRGDELNSVMEQAPALAKSIADYMQVSVGELREMGSQGQITADIVKNALFAAAKDTNAEFEKTPMTWAQVWTVASNTAVRALDPLLTAINWVANNIETIGPIILSIGAAFVVFETLTHLTQVWTIAITVAKAALAFGPQILIIAAIAGAIYGAAKAFIGFAGSAQNAAGMVIGSFATMGAFIINGTIVPVYNELVAFANFLANLFNDPVAAVATLFLDLATAVVSYIKNIASAVEGLLNKLTGKSFDFTSFLDNRLSSLQEEKNIAIKTTGNGKYKEYFQKIGNIDLKTAYTAGYNWGSNLDVSSMFGSTGTGNLEIPQATSANELLGNIDTNTGKIAKTVDLSDEQIKMLVDVAERKYVNNVNLTSQTPMITVQGQNTGNTEKDARNLADTLRDVLVDLMNAGSTVTVQ